VYKVESKEFLFNFKALISAWGLPFIDVTPEDIIEPFFTMIHPTEGFSLVDPKCSEAFLNANLINLLSKLF
jgi:hypothetical protein